MNICSFVNIFSYTISKLASTRQIISIKIQMLKIAHVVFFSSVKFQISRSCKIKQTDKVSDFGKASSTFPWWLTVTLLDARVAGYHYVTWSLPLRLIAAGEFVQTAKSLSCPRQVAPLILLAWNNFCRCFD